MKNYLLLLFALVIVGCGNRHSQQVATTQSVETVVTDSSVEDVAEETDIEILQDSTSNIAGGESLNEIRFRNWTEKDWYDNDYFRALRKYIDACSKGKIRDEVLEPYKSALNGKFAIPQAQPHLGGACLFVSFF